MFDEFTDPVAEGKITEYKDFFWHIVSLNRRGYPDEPLVRFEWDEDYEQQRVDVARAELAVQEAKSEEQLREEYEDYCRLTGEWNDKRAAWDKGQQRRERLESMRKQASKAYDKAPPILRDQIEWHEKLVREETFSDFQPIMDYEEYKQSELKSAAFHLRNAEERYSYRRDRVAQNCEFWEKAIEHFGEPPPGISLVTKSSSSMF